MPPRPVVTKITTPDALRINVQLENHGDAPLNTGHVFGQKTFKDGSVSEVMSFAYTNLGPGEGTKVFINGLANCKQVDIHGYRVNKAEAYPMDCTMAHGFWGWKLKKTN
jgi:hypothetical protein